MHASVFAAALACGLCFSAVALAGEENDGPWYSSPEHSQPRIVVTVQEVPAFDRRMCRCVLPHLEDDPDESVGEARSPDGKDVKAAVCAGGILAAIGAACYTITNTCSWAVPATAGELGVPCFFATFGSCVGGLFVGAVADHLGCSAPQSPPPANGGSSPPSGPSGLYIPGQGILRPDGSIDFGAFCGGLDFGIGDLRGAAPAAASAGESDSGGGCLDGWFGL